jgi:dolichol-phosphate mannosyltransferase
MLGPELTVVVPTFNERDNVETLVRQLGIVLEGVRWEVLFVDDDSPDGTVDVIHTLARTDARVRIIRRIRRRGLASACVEGILASTAPYTAVMDADLQHDERLLPKMFRTLRDQQLDVVVGSRYVTGGDTGEFSHQRERMSRRATSLARSVLKVDLQDPMSGYFVVRRDVVDAVAPVLSQIGFKILVDIFASSSRPLRYVELPYTFRSRHAGESKLDTTVVWEFGILLLDKTVGRYLPVRFVAFALVGLLGVLTHVVGLVVLFRLLRLSFVWSEAIAVLAAITTNFFINNVLTYRDQRLQGFGLIRGWVTFTLVCSFGAISNVGVALYLFTNVRTNWIWSGLAGVAVGAVWNYVLTATFTWKAINR